MAQRVQLRYEAPASATLTFRDPNGARVKVVGGTTFEVDADTAKTLLETDSNVVKADGKAAKETPSTTVVTTGGQPASDPAGSRPSSSEAEAGAPPPPEGGTAPVDGPTLPAIGNAGAPDGVTVTPAPSSSPAPVAGGTAATGAITLGDIPQGARKGGSRQASSGTARSSTAGRSSSSDK